MSRRGIVAFYRLVLGALALAGIIVQLSITLASGTSVVNFFSYFTILSNLLGSVVFLVGAVRLLRRTEPSGFDVGVRGASVVYLVFVGIVFNTLLRDVDLGSLQPWINVVHHLVMPAAVLLDWLIWPPHRRISVRTAVLWMLFPAAYVAYSLIRGSVTGFYAYPFFDPAANGGYGGVAAYCAVLIVVFVALAFLVRWLGNLGHSRLTGERPARR